jgi:hypothetical protein
MKTANTSREEILGKLTTFIQQRPGLEYGNYGEPTCYRAEVRRIGRDLRQARELLRAVRLSAITADELLTAFRGSRLTWTGTALEYTTGQYWPTEYRPAVCRVLVSALWSYYRECCNCDTADQVRDAAKRDLSRSIVRHWFL